MTHSDCYHMGDKPPKTKVTFLEKYKALCRSHKMHLGVCCNESGTDIWQDIEEGCDDKDLTNHFNELESVEGE